MIRNCSLIALLFVITGCASNGTVYQYRKIFDSGIGMEQAKAQCEYDNHLQSRADSRADKGGGVSISSLLGQPDTTFVACMKRFGYSWEIDSVATNMNQGYKLVQDKDYEKAFEKYMNSATKGDSIAQQWVGHFYENGLGVSKDFKQAFYWYKASAIQGLKESQQRLSVLYFYGAGVQKDVKKAWMWGRLAINNGITGNLADFEKKMTGAEIDEAKEMLHKCNVIGLKNCEN